MSQPMFDPKHLKSVSRTTFFWLRLGAWLGLVGWNMVMDGDRKFRAYYWNGRMYLEEVK